MGHFFKMLATVRCYCSNFKCLNLQNVHASRIFQYQSVSRLCFSLCSFYSACQNNIYMALNGPAGNSLLWDFLNKFQSGYWFMLSRISCESNNLGMCLIAMNSQKGCCHWLEGVKIAERIIVVRFAIRSY